MADGRYKLILEIFNPFALGDISHNGGKQTLTFKLQLVDSNLQREDLTIFTPTFNFTVGAGPVFIGSVQ